MTGRSDDTRGPFEPNAFHQSADVLNIVLESLNQGMVVVGADYRVLAFNRQLEALFQLPLGTVGVGVDFRDVLKTWAEVNGHGDQILDRAILQLDMATPFEFEFLQHVKGEPRWLLLAHNPLPGRGFVRTFTDITERKRSEDVRRISEERFRLAMLATKQGWFDLNLKTGEVIASKEFAGIIGYETSGSPMTYQTWVDSMHRDDRSAVLQRFNECLNTGESRQMEYRIMARTGEWKWIRSSAKVVAVDETGRPERMTGTHADITERKQAEAALRESEERWKFAIEGAGDGLWDWNVQTGKAYYSPRYKAMYGYAEADIGTTSDEWSKRIHPDDAPGVFATLQPYLEGKPGHAMVELRMLCKDGSWRWTLGRGMVVSRDTDGKPMRMIGTNTDISERKVADSKNTELLTRLEMISSRVPGLLFQFRLRPDGSFHFPYASQAMQETYRVSPEEAFEDGSRVFESIYPEDLPAVWASIEASAKNLSLWQHEFRTKFEGDTIRFFRGEAVPQQEADGSVLWHGLNIDITESKLAEIERVRLQAQLQQSQKMESLGTLAGGVAHDMNNVLGAILGLASAHIGSQPYGSPLHHALDTICKATERGGRMVKSLLGFARQNPAENHELDLNDLLSEQVALLERTTLANVRLQMDLEHGLRPIQGDASALAHAFMNLCVNAVDAMPEHGALTLHTRNVDNDWIEVVVEDDGMGMPKEVLERAMDPFFTTKPTGMGTGLGLSMVFSTVKAHRGQMAIESEPGKGTRVMLRFPACENEAQGPASVESETSLAFRKALRVLLIDDDELIQSSIQAILEVLGHTAVSTAQCGEEALGMLEAGLEPDLVILDMNMPGLGGAGTLPRLRGLRPDVPILLSTGRTDQTALTLASAHPGVTLLAKPFGMRELKKHLDNIGLG